MLPEAREGIGKDVDPNPECSPEEKLTALDRAFRRVVNVSNKSVQRKMAAEKKRRKRK
jgi:hypothetical protein